MEHDSKVSTGVKMRRAAKIFPLIAVSLLSGCFSEMLGKGREGTIPETVTGPVQMAVTKTPDKDPAGDIASYGANTARHSESDRPSSTARSSAGGALVPLQQKQPLARNLVPLPGFVRPAKSVRVKAAAAITYHDAILTEDTTWRGDVLVEGALTISSQTTLTIEPGTVVRFRRTADAVEAGPTLVVQGRLQVRGTADRPVRFTSEYQEPLAGDWQGIILLASEKKNLLEHCRIEGAVTGLDASFSSFTLKHVHFSKCGTGLRARDCVATVAGGGASECDLGCELAESEVDARETVLSANRQGMVVWKSSLYMEGASFAANEREGFWAVDSKIRLDGNVFEKNGSGVVLSGCEGGVAGGRIAGNRETGITLASSRVKVYGNEIAQNGEIGMRIEDGRGIAWGNSFFANTRYDIYNAGVEDFKAIANWWGDVPAASLEKRIYHAVQDATRGRILLFPPLKTRPRIPILNSIAK